MPSKADKYRENAAACARKAEAAHDPGAKHDFEESARQWRHLAYLADEAERHRW